MRDTPLGIKNDHMTVHMIKLVVGVEDLEHFYQIQQHSLLDFNGVLANPVRTRFKPKREDEIIGGGSLYRVIKNKICCRQKIIGFDQYESPDKGTQTLIMVEPEIIQVYSTPKRPFQGWRYLEAKDAPKDRGVYLGENQLGDIPEDLENDLAEAGLL